MTIIRRSWVKWMSATEASLQPMPWAQVKVELTMPVFLRHQSLSHPLKSEARLGSERHHLRRIHQARHGDGVHEGPGNGVVIFLTNHRIARQ